MSKKLGLFLRKKYFILGFVKTCSDFVFGWDVYDLLGFIPNFGLRKKKKNYGLFLKFTGITTEHKNTWTSQKKIHENALFLKKTKNWLMDKVIRMS